MTDSSPKQEPPYGLRMPPDLKARVKAAAEVNNRSMNAEIVATLEEKYPKVDELAELRRRVHALLNSAPLTSRSNEAVKDLQEMMTTIYRLERLREISKRDD